MIKVSNTEGVVELNKKRFPKLMISSKEVVVLMDVNGYGIVLAVGNSKYTIGHWSDDWDMDCFCDYNEQIIIKNV